MALTVPVQCTCCYIPPLVLSGDDDDDEDEDEEITALRERKVEHRRHTNMGEYDKLILRVSDTSPDNPFTRDPNITRDFAAMQMPQFLLDNLHKRGIKV